MGFSCDEGTIGLAWNRTECRERDYEESRIMIFSFEIHGFLLAVQTRDQKVHLFTALVYGPVVQVFLAIPPLRAFSPNETGERYITSS